MCPGKGQRRAGTRDTLECKAVSCPVVRTQGITTARKPHTFKLKVSVSRKVILAIAVDGGSGRKGSSSRGRCVRHSGARLCSPPGRRGSQACPPQPGCALLSEAWGDAVGSFQSQIPQPQSDKRAWGKEGPQRFLL